MVKRDIRLSQEVKVLFEAIVVADAVIFGELLADLESFAKLLLEFSRLVADVVVLGNLVGVLTRSRDFDRARPVGIHEAELVGHVLDVRFGEVLGLVEADEEVSRSHAALSGLLRHKEEVEAEVVVLVLDKPVVDDASWRWVVDSRAVLDEHPLVDALVDDHQSDWGRPGGSVVEAAEHFSELGDLLLDDLVAHALADTIPVDDDLGRVLISMILGEGVDSLFHALVQFSLD